MNGGPQRAQRAEAVSSRPVETFPSTPFSALIVDDDPGVRQSLRLCLEADGARALGVGSTQAALDALGRGRFDVVLLDLWLGSESGIDAIPDMLRVQPSASIVVITAFATFESAVEAMKKGAKDYLPKPFTPDQVRHAVRRALEAQRLLRQLRDAEERLAQVGADDDFFETESPVFWESHEAGGARRRGGCAGALTRRERHREKRDGALAVETWAARDRPLRLCELPNAVA